MTKSEKKQQRKNFRDAVFGRDQYKCRMCGEPAVDAHHVTDRNEFTFGGYILENGIALCASCHIKAEMYHSTGQAEIGYHPNDLYAIIGSSFEIAKAADKIQGIK